MSDIDSVIRERVQAFVDELGELVRQAALESVENALGTNGARRGPLRGRRANGAARVSARAKGQKRSPAELEELTATLLSAVKKAPGSRIEQIGKAMGVSTKELMLPTRKLLEDGAIKKRGVKRSTQYYPR